MNADNDSIWRELTSRIGQKQVPHALLLSGVTLPSIMAFADQLAATLLCQNPDSASGMACGTCQACQWRLAGTHADRLTVEPEEDSRSIKIQQIRNLCAELALTAQHGGYRVAVIQPADAMTDSASNSLLKSLEEPPPGVVMLLLSTRPGVLSPTIRSRCQRYRLARVDVQSGDEAVLQTWLSALSRRESPTAIAAEWSQSDHESIFSTLFSWLHGEIRGNFEVVDGKSSSTGPTTGNFPGEAAKIELQQLFGFYDKLLRGYRMMTKPGINRRVLYEQLFIEAQSLHLRPDGVKN